jgi:preprotein translocase subunit Sec61beta
MAKDKKKEGFHSAAGLIRYFEAEDDKALKLHPWLVVGLTIGGAVLVAIAAMLWPV